MADEASLHRRVTEFMLDTCRYTFDNDIVVMIDYVRAVLSSNEVFNSGSTAELYIKPMLSCIGDIDVMMVSHGILAISHGHRPPTALPSHYEREVHVVDITDSPHPGYVYLRLSYILQKDVGECYVAVKVENRGNGAVFFPRQVSLYQEGLAKRFGNEECQNVLSQMSLITGDTAFHGPAMHNSKVSEYFATTGGYPSALSLDFVPCVRCFVWPPQAADWPTRFRSHSWPDPATVSTVVANGCDVVGAVHPSCRQDEWMSKHQMRLSFSRAEITLLNSWNPVQQIIYHMLRFVMKRQVLSKADDDDPNLPKLCNYHIKTLMLWECEQKPQSWWSAESSLIKLCSSLLHKLSDWVSVKRCQHYFISNCNLLGQFVDGDASLIVCTRLRSLSDESVLLSWFLRNYIRECAHSCPAEVSSLFEDIHLSENVERVVDATVDWRWSKLPQESYNEHNMSEVIILDFIHMHCRDGNGTRVLTNGLRKFSGCHRDYFIAMISLRVAYKISLNSLTEDLLEILGTLFGSSAAAVGDMTSSEFEPAGGMLFVRKAIELASLCSVDSNALQMLRNEMSKAYLHHSLTYGHESIYIVVHVLLAALYYKSGHYQAAIDHCKQVLNQTACEQYGLRCIGAEYLPQIDEDVDAVLGLILFYEYMQRNTVNYDKHAQPIQKPSFTIALLAHYLRSQCSSAKSSELSMYRLHLINTDRPLLSDVLLFSAVQILLEECAQITDAEMRCEDTGNNVSATMDSSLLVTALELVALEKLITVRQVMVRELHSEQFPIMNEFEALYAYKCGAFEECLEMCRNRVTALLPVGCAQVYFVKYPELLCLLDGELVPLYGLLRLLRSVSGVSTEYPEYCLISVATLSLYLMVQCQKKLRSDSLRETFRLILLFYRDVVCLYDDQHFLEHLVLRMTYRSLKLYAESRRADEHTR